MPPLYRSGKKQMGKAAARKLRSQMRHARKGLDRSRRPSPSWSAAACRRRRRSATSGDKTLQARLASPALPSGPDLPANQDTIGKATNQEGDTEKEVLLLLRRKFVVRFRAKIRGK